MEHVMSPITRRIYDERYGYKRMQIVPGESSGGGVEGWTGV